MPLEAELKNNFPGQPPLHKAELGLSDANVDLRSEPRNTKNTFCGKTSLSGLISKILNRMPFGQAVLLAINLQLRIATLALSDHQRVGNRNGAYAAYDSFIRVRSNALPTQVTSHAFPHRHDTSGTASSWTLGGQGVWVGDDGMEEQSRPIHSSAVSINKFRCVELEGSLLHTLLYFTSLEFTLQYFTIL